MKAILGIATGLLTAMVVALALLARPAFAEGCGKPLLLGWKSQSPFLFVNARGHLSGLDYEIVATALADAGCKLKHDPHEIPWKRQLVWIETGELDLIVGASRTAEREQYAYFSAPYRDEAAALFVRKGESARFPLASLRDIMKPPFGVLGIYRGSYYGADFAEWMKDPAFRSKVGEVGEDQQNLQMLLAGRIDGVLLDTVAGTELLRQAGMLGTQIERHPLPAITTGQIHVMFSRKSVAPETVTQFNLALERLQKSGRRDAIVRKYMPDS